jgi:hypothetical protein
MWFMSEPAGHSVFPRWTNRFVVMLGALAAGGALYAGVLVVYGAAPETTDVGYMPKQPVPYSHALHAGELGLDCRYCHTTVEDAAFAAVPPTQTCMNCHSYIRPDSDRLLKVRESNASGMPIEWVKVHDLPDFVYFNHASHVTKGVSCVECHGRVDKMEEVYQAKALSMAWCITCHRNPGPSLRPVEQVTNLAWKPPTGEERQVQIADLLKENRIRSSRKLTDCSTCHR